MIFSPTPSVGSVIPPTPVNGTSDLHFEPYPVTNDVVAYVSASSPNNGPQLSPNMLGLETLMPLTPAHSPAREEWLSYLVTPTKESEGLHTPRPPILPPPMPLFAPAAPSFLTPHGLQEDINIPGSHHMFTPLDTLHTNPIPVQRQSSPPRDIARAVDHIDPRLLITVPLPMSGPGYEYPHIEASATIVQADILASALVDGLGRDQAAGPPYEEITLNASQFVSVTPGSRAIASIPSVEVKCGARTQDNDAGCDHVFKITGLRCAEVMKHLDSEAHTIEYRSPHPSDKTQENTRVCPDTQCWCNAPNCEQRKRGVRHRAHVKDLREHWRIQHLRYKWYCDFCQDVEWSSAWAFGRHREKCRQKSVLERQAAVRTRARQRERRGPEVSRCTACAALFQSEDAHRQHILERFCSALVTSTDTTDIQPQLT
jgi:hypothetical protein